MAALPHPENMAVSGTLDLDGLGALAMRDDSLRPETEQMLRSLERAFNQSLTIVDCASGQTLKTGSQGLPVELSGWLPVCEQIARRGRPHILDEVSPVILFAIPLVGASTERPLVAIGSFLTENVATEGEIAAAAQTFGVSAAQAFQWAATQSVWLPSTLQEVSTAIAEKATLQLSNRQIKRQMSDISSHLLMTFEEITLLHRLTEHLSISQSVVDICELSVNWLGDVIPAQSVAIWLENFDQVDNQRPVAQETERHSKLITHGECPLTQDELPLFMEWMGAHAATDPVVLNRSTTCSQTWSYPRITEVISVPIREGNRLFGWLLAFNHTGTGLLVNHEVEFGSVEACLVASVATILGIHCGNTAHYHEQSKFFSSVVRALTSAIDAKDPYTCGHSDRVARLAVCLARQIGVEREELNTIYLSGLLHDIGKIGIDDNVLRKPGALTPAEFEHIKTHPELGCRILDGVKQLDKVLPVVRHHHEAWNGCGYPAKLKAEETPLLARIVAVADSIDAMSSDRHYRKGMSDEKLDGILREGAGKQWDPRVIEAAFQVRDELRRIGKEERRPISLDIEYWQFAPSAEEHHAD